MYIPINRKHSLCTKTIRKSLYVFTTLRITQKNCIDERENETSTIFIKGNSLKSPHSELISVPLQDQKLTSSIQLSPLSAIKQPVLKTNSGAEIWVNVTYAPGNVGSNRPKYFKL